MRVHKKTFVSTCAQSRKLLWSASCSFMQANTKAKQVYKAQINPKQFFVSACQLFDRICTQKSFNKVFDSLFWCPSANFQMSCPSTKKGQKCATGALFWAKTERVCQMYGAGICYFSQIFQHFLVPKCSKNDEFLYFALNAYPSQLETYLKVAIYSFLLRMRVQPRNEVPN